MRVWGRCSMADQPIVVYQDDVANGGGGRVYGLFRVVCEGDYTPKVEEYSTDAMGVARWNPVYGDAVAQVLQRAVNRLGRILSSSQIP